MWSAPELKEQALKGPLFRHLGIAQGFSHSLGRLMPRAAADPFLLYATSDLVSHQHPLLAEFQY